MPRKKKEDKNKMEQLEAVVDEIIKAPIADKPKRTRKPRKKKVIEEAIEKDVIKLKKELAEEIKELKPSPVPPVPIPHPVKDTGHSEELDKTDEDDNIYRTPVALRHRGYKIIGSR